MMESDDSDVTASQALISSQALTFDERGFLVIPDIFTSNEINSMQLVAMDNFDAINSSIEKKNILLGIGIKEGYKEIVQRHLKRFEMPFRMDNDTFDMAACNPIILGIVTRILGEGHKIINRSLVISLPGALDQSWHSDGPHLSVTTDLPCHCLNVFIPLVDVDMINGPTAFRPESCYYTRDLSKLYMKAFMKKTLKPIESPCLKKGSILMFDYRSLSLMFIIDRFLQLKCLFSKLKLYLFSVIISFNLRSQ